MYRNPAAQGQADKNQPEILKAISIHNRYNAPTDEISTVSTTAQGNGFPDLVMGYRGKNFLVEIKDPNLNPSERKLRPSQVNFKEAWRGQYSVAMSIDDVFKIIDYQGQVIR